MEWTPFPQLIQQYRQEAALLEKKIRAAQAAGGFEGNYKKVECLCSMKDSLEHSIRLMNKYRESEESP